MEANWVVVHHKVGRIKLDGVDGAGAKRESEKD